MPWLGPGVELHCSSVRVSWDGFSGPALVASNSSTTSTRPRPPPIPFSPGYHLRRAPPPLELRARHPPREPFIPPVNSSPYSHHEISGNAAIKLGGTTPIVALPKPRYAGFPCHHLATPWCLIHRPIPAFLSSTQMAPLHRRPNISAAGASNAAPPHPLRGVGPLSILAKSACRVDCRCHENLRFPRSLHGENHPFERVFSRLDLYFLPVVLFAPPHSLGVSGLVDSTMPIKNTFLSPFPFPSLFLFTAYTTIPPAYLSIYSRACNNQTSRCTTLQPHLML